MKEADGRIWRIDSSKYKLKSGTATSGQNEPSPVNNIVHLSPAETAKDVNVGIDVKVCERFTSEGWDKIGGNARLRLTKATLC